MLEGGSLKARNGPAPAGAQRFRKLAFLVGLAIVAGILTTLFGVQPFLVPTESMSPTISAGDTVLVLKAIPRLVPISRGYIVVFSNPGGWQPSAEESGHTLSELGALTRTDGAFVKRVIGLPGDHVQCCSAEGELLVNGKALNESAYVKLPAGANVASADNFSVRVPRGMLWVMGDNRFNSIDSRYSRDTAYGGFVPIGDVLGKTIAIAWPLKRVNLL